MPKEKMSPFNPEVKRSIDPKTGVIFTPEEEAMRRKERDNPTDNFREQE